MLLKLVENPILTGSPLLLGREKSERKPNRKKGAFS
jgi:hypothetical protein